MNVAFDDDNNKVLLVVSVYYDYHYYSLNSLLTLYLTLYNYSLAE